MLPENGDWRPSCTGLTFDVLGDAEVALLEEPFSEIAVFKALSDLSGDKAPGPDGFFLAFWQCS